MIVEMEAKELDIIPSSSRIIGGSTVLTDSTGLSHPYPAYVQLRISRINAFLQESSSFTCGGVIVHAWPKLAGWPAGFWVLTAAHCLNPGNTYTINLWTGQGSSPNSPISQLPTGVTSSRNAPGWRQIGPRGIRIYAHPLFDNDSLDHDIALIRVLLPDSMDLPDTLTPPQSLPEFDTADPTTIDTSQSLKIIGFGKTQRQGAVSDTLQQANARRSNTLSTPPGKFPVVGVSDHSSLVTTCQGDSGGPLLRQNGRIVSGTLCCGYCASTEVSDEDLKILPSFYSAVRPYIHPPQGTFYTMGLPQNSPWQKGMVRIIEDASPTAIRTSNILTPTPTPDLTDAEEIGNDWAEMPVHVSLWSRLLRLILYYIEGAIIPILVAVAVITILFFLARGAARRAKRSGKDKPAHQGRVSVGEERDKLAK